MVVKIYSYILSFKLSRGFSESSVVDRVVFWVPNLLLRVELVSGVVDGSEDEATGVRASEGVDELATGDAERRA